MSSTAMAKRIEIWRIEKLTPFTRNARTHSEGQIAQIAASILEFGFNAPILVDSNSGVIAGHGRLLAARKLGMAEVPVIVLDHLSEIQKRAYIIADNKLALNSGWDEELLAAELADLEKEGLDLTLVGFSEDELRDLLQEETGGPATGPDEEIQPVPVNPITRPGDLWAIGPHRILCGDCRNPAVVARLFAGSRANLVVTSPPYAKQRQYDASSGFEPVLPWRYVAWFCPVAANIASVLASDGSYFLNIKEHSEEGERSLYVKDLVTTHKRQWGWRFVDEFCWRNTANGVPGKWPNRLKNAWEPVFHFSRGKEIKFRPLAAGHISDDVVQYSPDNPSASSGSGLLGHGASTTTGVAWPSNVIEARAEGEQGSHSAPFPRALPEFFLKAFSDAGDIVFDPFAGSGTTIAAARVLDRIGFGIEISPGYCDVVLRRIASLVGVEPVLAETNHPMSAVAAVRGVDPAYPASPPNSRPTGSSKIPVGGAR
jgi:DNA modification methylase